MIKFFKLSNGEEIVAEVKDNEEAWSNYQEMSHPYRNVMTDRGSMLVPYPCDSISVAMNHVIFFGKVKLEVEKVYLEATGKVVVPQNRIQLPNQPRMNNNGNR